MSNSTVFIKKIASEHAKEKKVLEQWLLAGRNSLTTEYENRLRNKVSRQESYLAFVEPLLAGLANLPEHVAIESIVYNPAGAPEVTLSTTLNVSIANLLMEYHPLSFVIDDAGVTRKPNTEKNDEAVYSGVMASMKPLSLHWASMVDNHVVQFFCKTDALSFERWNNPTETGAAVASVVMGDMSSGNPWHSFDQDGAVYWVQPASPVSSARLNNAKEWREKTALSALLRERFNNGLLEIPTLHSAQAKIIVNALFSWATSKQELPVKEDFIAWTPPRGNVLAMHSEQDWTNLTLVTPQDAMLENAAQRRIKTLSARLPNIWRFTNDVGISILCDTMAETRMHLNASQSLEP